jgi:hypothetical protein
VLAKVAEEAFNALVLTDEQSKISWLDLCQFKPRRKSAPLCTISRDIAQIAVS